MLVLFVDYKMPALSFLRTYPYTNASLTGCPGHTLIIQNAGATEAGPGHTGVSQCRRHHTLAICCGGVMWVTH